MTILLIIVSSLLCGFLLFLTGWFAKGRVDKLHHQSIEEQTTRMLDEARQASDHLKREKLIEVRDEHLRLKTQIENDFEHKRVELTRLDRQFQEKDRGLNQKTDILEKRGRELKQIDRDVRERTRQIETQSKRVQELESTVASKLEEIARMTREEALRTLRTELIDRARTEAADMIKDIRDRARLQANREAKEIVVQAIQRSAADHSAETTVTVVNIPNDEIKGRIIGREGRNIRSFESATGVEVIIDDTPEAVTLSGFDPMRREVARIALENLIEDGRIHPARIEEVIRRAQKELDERVLQIGEQTTAELGIDGMHIELMQHLGKLHYRTSYGQNVLKHSIEVARLAALMAAQLGLDAKMAIRAGLLHDIGKAIDRSVEGTHTELGVELARRFREPRVVINAIESHHGDLEATSLIACLVQAADAISGARPGARRDSLEGYVHRLEKLEAIANGFPGVTKTFALQAGREIRVMVEHEKVSDAQAEMLAQGIAEKIQQDLEYPGQIKVTVIREFRAVEFAK
ncbi:MAG: ribonuclease Y [Calditrichota bacterium]